MINKSIKIILAKEIIIMSPRSKKANNEIKDERRVQILQAALNVFIHKGFAAAKMSDIASKAGISYGLTYHYFKSKDDMYAEIVKSSLSSMKDELEKIKELNIKPIDKLKSCAQRILLSIDKKESTGYLFIVVFEALINDSLPNFADYALKNIKYLVDMLSEIIKEGQEIGQIRNGDPVEIAVTFFSAVFGIASFNVSGIIKKRPDVEMLMRIF